MVIGFESFKEHFKGYEDCYTVIGGTACDILMSQVGVNFRATKDIDMILLIENRFEEFADIFWQYINKGRYRCGWHSSPNLHFYRFTEPDSKKYPLMIELFSRVPDKLMRFEESKLVPLPVNDEISSLSAILLDDEYYSLMREGREIVDGVAILGTAYLIPFKAKAWLDLTIRKENGESVDSRDIKKHKNDIFRLFTIIDPTMKVKLSQKIKDDLHNFFTAIEKEQSSLKDLGIRAEVSDVLNILRNIFF